uniref:Uncharacterized protein n=1 Tax=Onchocerca volvulus TaxID=6282 RepID=A0A8R1XQR2_ONCVO
MDMSDPYSVVRAILDKFPTDENAKDSMEQRDMTAQRIHTNILNSIEQMNNLKPFYNEKLNANITEKERLLNTLHTLERDIGRRKLALKEEEVELEDLQQLSEMRRDFAKEQRKQFELLKIAEVANKESWKENTANFH